MNFEDYKSARAYAWATGAVSCTFNGTEYRRDQDNHRVGECDNQENGECARCKAVFEAQQLETEETEGTLAANALADAYSAHATDGELKAMVEMTRRIMTKAGDITGPVFLARLEMRLQQREARQGRGTMRHEVIGAGETVLRRINE